MRPRHPLIVAHRGLHADLPENSVAALTAAWAAGVEWAECDVRASADGTLYLIHDEMLDRTTTGCGAIARAVGSRLDVRLTDRRHRPTGHRLPKLTDALAAIRCQAVRPIVFEP